VSNYQSTLFGREEIAAWTMAFHFAKPAGFSFKAGQAIDIVLSDPAGVDDGNTRHTFSIVTAPFEDKLTIATRMRDTPFKRRLKDLPDGSPIGIEGPSGSLVLHSKPERAAIMIAGGIGITPFVSILRQAAIDPSPRRLVLLYSNHRPEDTAFLAELQAMERSNPNFRLLATMTRMDESSQGWQGATEGIDEKLLRRIAAELAAPIYYLAGPPAMVAAMRQTLNEAGVDDDDLRSEEFYGY
jgi:ferredoxin-NADP reductase